MIDDIPIDSLISPLESEDIVSYSASAAALAKDGQWQRALHLLRQLQAALVFSVLLNGKFGGLVICIYIYSCVVFFPHHLGRIN